MNHKFVKSNQISENSDLSSHNLEAGVEEEVLVHGEEVEEDVVLRAHAEGLPDGVHVGPDY